MKNIGVFYIFTTERLSKEWLMSLTALTSAVNWVIHHVANKRAINLYMLSWQLF